MIRGLVMCLPDASSSPVSKLRELLPTGLYNQFHFVFGLLADDNFLVQVLVHQLSDVPLKKCIIIFQLIIPKFPLSCFHIYEPIVTLC